MLAPGFYNMNCMDALPQFPDKFFDLAIVDPPYGDGLNNKPLEENAEHYNRFGGRFAKYKTPDKIVERRGGQWAAKYANNIIEWDVAPPPHVLYRVVSRFQKPNYIWRQLL